MLKYNFIDVDIRHRIGPFATDLLRDDLNFRGETINTLVSLKRQELA